MRMKPPSMGKKKYIKSEEFKEYLLKHTVIGGDEPIPFLQFYKEIKESPKLAIDSIATMFPWEYQPLVIAILWEMEKNNEL